MLITMADLLEIQQIWEVQMYAVYIVVMHRQQMWTLTLGMVTNVGANITVGQKHSHLVVPSVASVALG